jgi:hypothetical protein
LTICRRRRGDGVAQRGRRLGDQYYTLQSRQGVTGRLLRHDHARFAPMSMPCGVHELAVVTLLSPKDYLRNRA